ncbi:MAG: hypothetical protein NT069_21345 [Planctomycetota bacterium]|nr:hypothetical protein [Planctomycetota bacterium]
MKRPSRPIQRYRTLSGMVWPTTPDESRLASDWSRSATVQALDWTWRAFDAMLDSILKEVNLENPLEQLERDLTQSHFSEIQTIWAKETGGFSSVRPHHEWPEMESRITANAKPPAYDLAFVCDENRRWAWPIEAKVVKSPGRISEYLGDVRNKFLTGIAAPLSGDGAMIAYLLAGEAVTLFENVSRELSCLLQTADGFAQRAHRTSDHDRTPAPRLRLHHLAMECSRRSEAK